MTSSGIHLNRLYAVGITGALVLVSAAFFWCLNSSDNEYCGIIYRGRRGPATVPEVQFTAGVADTSGNLLPVLLTPWSM